MSGPRICTTELRKLGPRFAEASEGAERLYPRRQAFLREGAARKTPLVLAERPQRLVEATGIELLLGFRKQGDLFRKGIRQDGVRRKRWARDGRLRSGSLRSRQAFSSTQQGEVLSTQRRDGG
ncbi:MAG TPA: hypothetical protein VKU41_03305 [Polyangiaceae bacterium]|nr:hypothetical protein [Polyangiaceae bacterium]